MALLSGVLGIGLAHWPTTAGLERGALDLLFKLRVRPPAPDGVCVVAIDDASYRELNLPGGAPVPRSIHAQLVRTLKAQGAAAVAFDVLFDTETTLEADLDLEAALAEAGNDVLGVSLMATADPRFLETRWVEPIPPLAEAAAVLGEVNFPTDPDGVIRCGVAHAGGPRRASPSPPTRWPRRTPPSGSPGG